MPLLSLTASLEPGAPRAAVGSPGRTITPTPPTMGPWTVPALPVTPRSVARGPASTPTTVAGDPSALPTLVTAAPMIGVV